MVGVLPKYIMTWNLWKGEIRRSWKSAKKWFHPSRPYSLCWDEKWPL